MRKLYELAVEFEKLAFQIDQSANENEGEIPSDLEAKLDAVKLEMDAKLENCCAMVKEFLGVANMLNAESSRLTKRADSYEAAAEALMKYLGQHVKPGTKWERGPHRIGWIKSTSCKLVDGVKAEDLPEAYRRAKYDLRADEAKRDLKAGADLWFAELVEKQNLQVK